MSRKKRAIEKQKRQNSSASKQKKAKKNYYASYAAMEKWEDKKARKEQRQCTERESRGISFRCPLPGWQHPDKESCSGCRLKCSFKRQ